MSNIIDASMLNLMWFVYFIWDFEENSRNRWLLSWWAYKRTINMYHSLKWINHAGAMAMQWINVE